MQLTEVRIKQIIEAAEDGNIIVCKPKRMSVFYGDHAYAVFRKDGNVQTFVPGGNGGFHDLDGNDVTLNYGEPIVDLTLLFGRKDAAEYEDWMRMGGYTGYQPYQSYDIGSLPDPIGQPDADATQFIRPATPGLFMADDYGTVMFQEDNA